jgi:ABC-type transporter lipoprotein component MlaA
LIIPRSERYVRKIYKLNKTEEDIILKYAVSDYAKKTSTYVKKKPTKKIAK